jgi:hypothetical protein
MASVFISFTHTDDFAAKAMSKFLQDLREVFGDDADAFRSSDRNVIYAGENWIDRIIKELETTKVLISMLSPKSIEKPWINFEAGAAWRGHAKVIPVCFGGQTIATLPKPYSILQAVELDNASACFYLAASIARHLERKQPEWPGRFSDKENELAKQPYWRLANSIRASGPAKATAAPEPGPTP